MWVPMPMCSCSRYIHCTVYSIVKDIYIVQTESIYTYYLKEKFQLNKFDIITVTTKMNVIVFYCLFDVTYTFLILFIICIYIKWAIGLTIIRMKIKYTYIRLPHFYMYKESTYIQPQPSVMIFFTNNNRKKWWKLKSNLITLYLQQMKYILYRPT